MSLFTAVQTGPVNDGATFGNNSPGVAGVDYPNPAGGDSLDLGGYTLTMDGPLVLVEMTDVATGGFLVLSDDLTCPLITDARMTCSTGPLNLVTGVVGNSEGIYVTRAFSDPEEEIPMVALLLAAGAVVDLVGDISNLGGDGISFGGGAIIASWTGDIYTSGFGHSILCSGGEITFWEGDLNLNTGSGLHLYAGGILKTWVGNLNITEGSAGVSFEDGGEITTWVGDCLNGGSGIGVGFYYEGDTIRTWVGNCINSGGGVGVQFSNVETPPAGSSIVTWVVTKCPEGVVNDGTGTVVTLVMGTQVAPAADVRSGVPRWAGATGADIGTFGSDCDLVTIAGNIVSIRDWVEALETRLPAVPASQGDVTAAHATTDAKIDGLGSPEQAGAAAGAGAAVSADVAAAHATTDGKVDAAKGSADAAKASADQAARPSDVTTAHVTTDGLIGALGSPEQTGAAAAAAGTIRGGTRTLENLAAPGDLATVKLASDGLDNVNVAQPSNAADAKTNLPKMIAGIFRWLLNRRTLTQTKHRVYKDDDATVLFDQAVSDDGTTQETGRSP